MLKISLSSIIVIISLANVALAVGPTVNAGSHFLLPNQSGQEIQVFVSGEALVQGLEFNIQIGDDTVGPVITDVDILTDTIFAESNTGIFPGYYMEPHKAYFGTTTNVTVGDGFIVTNGLLATITLDTTGITTGEFELRLISGNAQTGFSQTNFAGIPANLINGTLSVPEPLSVTMLLAGGVGMVWRRRRKSIS